MRLTSRGRLYKPCGAFLQALAERIAEELVAGLDRPELGERFPVRARPCALARAALLIIL